MALPHPSSPAPHDTSAHAEAALLRLAGLAGGRAVAGSTHLEELAAFAHEALAATRVTIWTRDGDHLACCWSTPPGPPPARRDAAPVDACFERRALHDGDAADAMAVLGGTGPRRWLEAVRVDDRGRVDAAWRLVRPREGHPWSTLDRALALQLAALTPVRGRTTAHERDRLATLGTIAAGVAHDFRGFLTAMQGYAQLLDIELAEREPGSGLRPLAHRIVTAGRHAALLTGQVLGLARPAGATPPTAVGHVLRELDHVLRAVLGSRRHLRLEIDEAAPPVALPADEVSQVVLNLVTNARDAILDEGTVCVRVRPGVGGTSTLVIVDDDGEGLAPVLVCGPEHTAHARPRSTRGPGRGLGLGIVERILRAHGGSLELRAGPRAGTRAVARLPAGA